MERNPSWICTLAIQLCLCLAFYLSLNLGRPQKSIYQKTNDIYDRRKNEFYFISVSGGIRPLQEQTHLLEQMENVANSYGVRFVVNTSELGEEDDPLYQNATMLFPSLKVPWYTTTVSKGQEIGFFHKQIKMSHGKVLDIVGVDTGLLQESMLRRITNGTRSNQFKWLKQTLESASGNWCIVVGSEPLIGCEDNENQTEVKEIYEPLHRIFVNFGVDAYLSKHGCSKYARHDSVTYIENPDLIQSVNGRETVDGFLLHRVTNLQIVTYFVTSKGEATHRIVMRPRGKEVM